LESTCRRFLGDALHRYQKAKARITVSWCRMSTRIRTSSLSTNDKRGFGMFSRSFR
jgi:hypothetical protein